MIPPLKMKPPYLKKKVAHMLYTYFNELMLGEAIENDYPLWKSENTG